MPDVTVAQWDLSVAEPVLRDVATQAGLGASLRLVPFATGQRGEMHSHPHEQFVLFLSGVGTLTSELGTTALGTGTLLHFMPHARHQAEFEEAGLLLEVNLPPPPHAG